MKRMTVVDLFCGAGGFSEGFRQAGFDVVFGLDNWKPAIETHKLNHPSCDSRLMDILDLDTPEKIDNVIPDTDVIIGSPPCIAFSNSNKSGKADKSLGIKLIEAFMRIVAWKRKKGVLRYWCLENVPNSSRYIKEWYSWEELQLPGEGPPLKIVKREILNAADFGAPQARRRFFCGDYPLPEKTHEGKWITMKEVMSILGAPLDGDIDRVITDPNYDALKMARKEMTDHFYDSRVEEFEWKEAKRLKEDHGFMGRMSFPENLDRPSRTIMATQSASTREAILFGATKDKKGDFRDYRLPTIREIACFMSFPLTYQFEGNSEPTKYKLVGNAVCPKIAAAIARAMITKSGLSPPHKIDFSHRPIPRKDLNGERLIRRGPRPKRLESKFAIHVPYLKANGFRVDLTNIESDFERNDIRWAAILHHGSGPRARKCDIDKEALSEMLSRIEGFDSFKQEIGSFVSNVPNADLFQRLYCRIASSDTWISPMTALKWVRKIVDKYYPESRFAKELIDNARGKVRIGKERIPVRIAAAAYACSIIVEATERAEIERIKRQKIVLKR